MKRTIPIILALAFLAWRLFVAVGQAVRGSIGLVWSRCTDAIAPITATPSFSVARWIVRAHGKICERAIVVAFLLLSLAGSSTGAWYDSAYLYRKDITVPATSIVGTSAITGMPLFLDLSADSDIVAHARKDGADILFTAADGTTKLPHELLPESQYITSSGAWTWFSQPRAIYVNGTHERLFVGYQSNSPGRGKVAQYDYGSGTLTETQVGTNDAYDDHVDPTLLCRSSDSKLLCFYEHTHNGVGVYRISTSAEDATAWGSEQAFDPYGDNNIAYISPHELTSVGRIYTTFRHATGGNWSIVYSTDNGATFATGLTTLSYGASHGWGTNPYLRAIDNGTNRIDFLMSNGDGAEATNYQVYHFYYDATTDKWRKSDGTDIGHAPPFSTSELTTIFDGTAGGDLAWIGDIKYKQNGQPHVLFVVYSGGTLTNHDLYHADFNGSTWSTEKVCDEGNGSFRTDGNTQYHGGSVLDFNHDDIIWAAVKATKYEIQKWKKTSGTWSKINDITSNSIRNGHVRPEAVRGCPDGKVGQILFMSPRDYADYTNYASGITAYPPLVSAIRRAYVKANANGSTDTHIYVYYGNANANNQEDVANVWSSYSRVYHGADHYGGTPFWFRDSTLNGPAFGVVSTVAGPSTNIGNAVTPLVGGSGGLSMGTIDSHGWTAATVEQWIYRTSASNIDWGLGQWSSGPVVRHFLSEFFNSGGDVYFYANTTSDTLKFGAFPTIKSAATTWEYWTMGWTSAGGIVGRKNKSHDAVSSTTATALSASTSGTTSGLGNYNSGSFLGNVAELRIATNALVPQDQTDSQYDNWASGNSFFTIGSEETAVVNRTFPYYYKQSSLRRDRRKSPLDPSFDPQFALSP